MNVSLNNKYGHSLNLKLWSFGSNDMGCVFSISSTCFLVGKMHHIDVQLRKHKASFWKYLWKYYRGWTITCIYTYVKNLYVALHTAINLDLAFLASFMAAMCLLIIIMITFLLQHIVPRFLPSDQIHMLISVAAFSSYMFLNLFQWMQTTSADLLWK